MKKTTELIAILGGTFDPIHNGHMQIAHTLLSCMPLSQVRFIPCKIPVHKNKPHANVDHRLNMLMRALADEPKLVIDQRELKRRTASYTILTLKSLNSEFTQATLCLILGLDVYLTLPSWKDWQEILHYCHIIITNRPQFDLKQNPAMRTYFKAHQAKNVADLYRQKNGLIYFPAIEPTALSATEVRRKILAGEALDQVLPPTVAAYVKAQRLYGSEDK